MKEVTLAFDWIRDNWCQHREVEFGGLDFPFIISLLSKIGQLQALRSMKYVPHHWHLTGESLISSLVVPTRRVNLNYAKWGSNRSCNACSISPLWFWRTSSYCDWLVTGNSILLTTYLSCLDWIHHWNNHARGLLLQLRNELDRETQEQHHVRFSSRLVRLMVLLSALFLEIRDGGTQEK